MIDPKTNLDKERQNLFNKQVKREIISITSNALDNAILTDSLDFIFDDSLNFILEG